MICILPAVLWGPSLWLVLCSLMLKATSCTKRKAGEEGAPGPILQMGTRLNAVCWAEAVSAAGPREPNHGGTIVLQTRGLLDKRASRGANRSPDCGSWM